MKILFTADWHIKLGQKNVPKDWQINRFHMLYDSIAKLQQEADILVIGGDIFDKMPSLEELELFFDFLPVPEIPTYIYDGNHEATKKGQTFLSRLKKIIETINPSITVVDKISNEQYFDIVPYCNLKDIANIEAKSSILCTHVRGEIPPYVKPEIDLTLLDKWDVVLAGDLHSYENSQRNILYPGSPLTTSFHRNKVTNGLLIFDTEDNSHRFIDLQLPQLIRKTVENVEDAIPTDFDHTIYEITGNIKDLANVDTTADFIDKKVVVKNTEKTLNLANKSIVEELIEYLQEVQQLDKLDIEEIVKTYTDIVNEEDL